MLFVEQQAAGRAASVAVHGPEQRLVWLQYQDHGQRPADI